MKLTITLNGQSAPAHRSALITADTAVTMDGTRIEAGQEISLPYENSWKNLFEVDTDIAVGVTYCGAYSSTWLTVKNLRTGESIEPTQPSDNVRVFEIA